MQERGEKRVVGLLQAAAAIFAEVGFEAATMRDIAERAGGSIGSPLPVLPQQRRRRTGTQDAILPRAEGALGQLGRRECKDNDESSRGSVSQCDNKGHRGASRHHPAHGRAALDQSRSRYQGIAPTTARRIVSTRKPRIFPIKAHRYAEITVQMVRALFWLYVETEPPEREALVAEMKSALVNYLSPRLAQ